MPETSKRAGASARGPAKRKSNEEHPPAAPQSSKSASRAHQSSPRPQRTIVTSKEKEHLDKECRDLAQKLKVLQKKSNRLGKQPATTAALSDNDNIGHGSNSERSDVESEDSEEEAPPLLTSNSEKLQTVSIEQDPNEMDPKFLARHANRQQRRAKAAKESTDPKSSKRDESQSSDETPVSMVNNAACAAVWAEDAFMRACQDKMESIVFTPGIQRLIMSKHSHMRNEILSAGRDIVPAFYGFRQDSSKDSRMTNRALVKTLLSNNAYAYKDHNLRSGFMESDVFPAMLRLWAFKESYQAGVIHRDIFELVSVASFAFYKFLVEYCLIEWKSGEFKHGPELRTKKYHGIYKRHLVDVEMWAKLDDTATTIIRRNFYKAARAAIKKPKNADTSIGKSDFDAMKAELQLAPPAALPSDDETDSEDDESNIEMNEPDSPLPRKVKPPRKAMHKSPLPESPAMDRPHTPPSADVNSPVYGLLRARDERGEGQLDVNERRVYIESGGADDEGTVYVNEDGRRLDLAEDIPCFGYPFALLSRTSSQKLWTRSETKTLERHQNSRWLSELPGGKPLGLLFDPFEAIVLYISVQVMKNVISDGKSNWLEGFILISLYVIVGVSFWFYPGSSFGSMMEECQPDFPIN
ncbi:hypothetical protein CYLTODRAFT_408035 [Cylindrobasidium torrendii FP15055 ss-10]|uniref:DUF6532 domain-containing protein n=1 Tax=Cylindrobasidium torrendii FP15055 ss-10 TaxID=1314674 RepID=A0A0D7BPH7_9AGAR|nr:hypothetical protein CYLTODRAFT_408035 [Cylindrobasidium torrendii FP15055 ss-10]